MDTEPGVEPTGLVRGMPSGPTPTAAVGAVRDATLLATTVNTCTPVPGVMGTEHTAVLQLSDSATNTPSSEMRAPEAPGGSSSLGSTSVVVHAAEGAAAGVSASAS